MLQYLQARTLARERNVPIAFRRERHRWWEGKAKVNTEIGIHQKSVASDPFHDLDDTKHVSHL